MLITVLPHAKCPAWPGPKFTERPTAAAAVRLADALTRAWATDAHFTAYAPTDPPVRVALGAFTHEHPFARPIRMQLAAFDFDDPQAHASGEPAGAEWRGEFTHRVGALLRVHPGLCWWFTRGGARLLGRLPDDVDLHTPAHAAEWTALYTCWVTYLDRCFSLRADPLGDCTRLFRLPHATRRAGADPDWYGPVRGQPAELGVWAPEVRRFLRELPRMRLPSGAPPAPRADGPPSVLVELLRRRGWLGRELGPGKWACECPSGLGHGLASDTVVWASGVLHCSHARCVGLDPWGAFSAGEVAAAIADVVGVTPLEACAWCAEAYVGGPERCVR